jgi:type I restriction enzyme S subunit
MDNGWLKTTLGELCDRGQAMIQTGPFGSQLHSYDYQTAGVPVVPTEAIGRRRIRDDAIPRVSESVVSRLARHKLRAGDILFARRGAQATGLSALVESKHEGWLCGTGAILMRLETADVDPTFLSFLFSSDSVISWLKAHAVGAVMPNLNEGILRRLPLLLPPLKEQRTIAQVLTTLDNKIELNRRMNETLEAISQALFKSWFLDATEDGLPNGWRMTYVGEETQLVKGVSYRSEELADSTKALVTLKSVARGGGYRPDGLKPYTGEFEPEQAVEPGELVVAQTDVTQAAEVIGRPALVLPDERFKTLVASLDLSIVRPTFGDLSQHFFYLLFLTADFQAHVYGHTNGTTVLHLGKKGVASYSFARPPESLARTFTEIVRPLFKKITANEIESRTLAKLRDALLRKLLSGEIRVKDHTKFSEEVIHA